MANEQLPGHIKFRPRTEESIAEASVDAVDSAQLPGHIKSRPRTEESVAEASVDAVDPSQLPGHIKSRGPGPAAEHITPPTDPSHRWWWDRTAPLLSTLLLCSGGYTPSEQASHLHILRDVVIPSLGPPTPAAHVRPLLTLDGSPFEASWNFQPGRDDLVRYTFEPLGGSGDSFSAESDPLMARQAAALAPILAAAADPPADMGWFEQLRRRWIVGPDDAEEAARAMVHLPPGQTRVPQLFVAYDMDGPRRILKTYHFTLLKHMAHGTAKVDVAFDAIRALQPGGDRLAPLIERLREFLSKGVLSPAFIDIVAIDCVDPSSARVKVYVRSPDNSAAMARRCMTLGGAQTDPVTLAGVDAMVNIWPLLLHESKGVADDYVKPAREPHPIHIGCCYVFEMRVGAERVEVKAHMPVSQYACSDDDSAVNFAEALKTLGWHDAADKFTRGVAAMAKLPGKDFSKPGALSYVSFNYNDKGPYMSCYFSAQTQSSEG